MESPIDPGVLRQRREAKGWNQRELARAASVDHSVVSRLERNLQSDVSVQVLLSLAKALDITVEDLLPPSARRQPWNISTELVAIVSQVAALSPFNQHQVTLLLRGYVAALFPSGQETGNDEE